jgi:hypothetical protein
MDMKELRRKVVNIAAELAQQEVERTGKDYKACIDKALDEACIRLGVNRKQFIEMFLR